jgi:hypothetical protein
MVSPATKTLFRGLVLSATELRQMTDWSDALIEDYLNIISNLAILADKLDVEIDQKIEEVPTDFLDGSIPFAEGGFLVEDNTNFNYNNTSDILNILNIIATSIIVAVITAVEITTTDITVNSLTEEMSVATDINKKLVSIPYLNEETEFFIQAVHS